MKKLYSNVLVCVVLKCNENRPTLLKEKKRKRCKKFPCFYMLYSYTVYRNWKKKMYQCWNILNENMAFTFLQDL